MPLGGGRRGAAAHREIGEDATRAELRRKVLQSNLSSCKQQIEIGALRDDIRCQANVPTCSAMRAGGNVIGGANGASDQAAPRFAVRAGPSAN